MIRPRRSLALTLVLVAAPVRCAPELDQSLTDGGAGAELPGPDGPLPPDRTLLRPDGDLNIGAPCTSSVQCSSGLACETGFPAGMCTRSCQEDRDCGALLLYGCLKGRCHPHCNLRAVVNPCRAGYACRAEGKWALCVPGCRAAGCTGGLTCDKPSDLCLDPKGGTPGAACSGSSVCTGTPNGICYQGGMGKGLCTIPCAPFTKPCPLTLSGAQCIGTTSSGAVCLFVCDATDTTCLHKDLTCTAVSDDVSLCLPK